MHKKRIEGEDASRCNHTDMRREACGLLQLTVMPKVSSHGLFCVWCRGSAEESMESSWMMRNDTLQTPGVLQTPQLTSTVLRENPRQAAEHLPEQNSEPGSESDYVHK